MPVLRFFDMFAGIGGFRTGLTRAGGFRCIGHCEIDSHADKAYRAMHNIKETEVFYKDAKNINTDEMPDFDVLCAGFPCQSFSIAGQRRGFEDQRGTLFFEIARILEAKQPEFFILENVPGLLNHDGGRTFQVILSTLSELGYGLEWQVLNSKDFGVPQSRKRVYIVGYLDPGCAGKIFPFVGTNSKAIIQLVGGSQGARVYDPSGIACTQISGGGGAKTGLYLVGCSARDGISGSKENAYTITASYGKGISANQARDGVLLIKEATKRGHKEAVSGNIERGGRIRRLMPRECLRLQGFSDEQIDKLLAVTSDSQAYKQAGNAVTVNVVETIGKRLYQVAKSRHEATSRPTEARKEASA